MELKDAITAPNGETLESYLAAHPHCEAFRVVPHYSVVGDMLSVYFKEDPGYAKQITPQVTLILSFATKEIVGVKIFGVKGLVEGAK